MITIADITRAVAMEFGLAPEELTSQARARSVAWPRHIAMYLAQERTHHNVSEIARRFNRTPWTGTHAIDHAREMIATDRNMARRVNKVRDVLDALRSAA